MKLPYPIQPARVSYEHRDLIPIRGAHALVAAAMIPVVGFVAYVVARLLFSIG